MMRENGKYRIMHGCYWIVCGVCFCYLAFYLSGYGYSASEIGVISALIGVVSAVLQPALGRLADRNSKYGWKPQLTVLISVCCIVLVLLLICNKKIVTGILFVILLVTINCICPLLNSISSYYELKGVHVDFGVARSCGSASYAVVTLIIGYLTTAFGVKAIPVSMILVPVVMLVVLRSMPYDAEESVISHTAASEKKTGRKKENFIQKYPAFCVILVASLLTFSVHNVTTIFLLQMIENVGGNSGHMGTALSIAAAAEMPAIFLFSHITKKIQPTSLMIIAGASYAVKMVLFMIAGNVAMIYVIHLLQFCSYGFYAPSTVRFAEDCMHEEDRVTGQAMMTMTTTLSSVIGSLLGGWMIDSYGMTVTLTASTGLSIFAVFFWVGGVLLYKKTKRGNV